MSLPLIFLSAFLVAFSGALMPGPLLTLTIATSLKRGFWQGPLIILGHGLLEIGLILVVILGGASIFKIIWVQKFVFLVGGVLLIYLGRELIVKNKKIEFRETEDKAKELPAVSIGILGSLSNPFWFIWWVTIGLGLLLQAIEYGAKGIILFFAGHISADLLWYSFISFSFSQGKKIMSDKVYRIIIYICSLFLFVLGGWFFVKLFK